MSPAAIFDKVKQILVEHLGCDPDKVTLEANIIDDLGADSLDSVEIVIAAEEDFGIPIDDDTAEKINTVKDFVEVIERKLAG